MHTNSKTTSSNARLGAALIITLGFVFVEGAAGLFANSLALLTDAAHNLTDVLALALSWYAMRLATRPSHSGKTFGYHRAGILAALANSTTLILIAIFIFYEAYRRLVNPPNVQENVLIAMAVVAFLVNAGTAWLVHRGSDHDLNLRSAYVHLAGDALSTLGAFVAGVGIKLTGWQSLDPLASLAIAGLILWNGWGIIREAVEILLESTPKDVNMEGIVSDLLAIPGVHNVHDLHVWSLNQGLRALSVHIQTEDILVSASHSIQELATQVLHDQHGISHATLQLECSGCPSQTLYCDWGNQIPLA